MFFAEKIPSGWIYRQQQIVPDGEYIELNCEEFEALINDRAIIENGKVVMI